VDIGGVRAASALVGVTADLRVAHIEVFQDEDAVLDVVDAIERLERSVQAITEVAYDEWRFHSEAIRLEREHGVRMVQFPQKLERRVRGAEALHAVVVEQRLTHPGHPTLTATSTPPSPSTPAAASASPPRRTRRQKPR
jgi:hypothetical protein